MPDFPSSIYSPVVKENVPKRTYDATKVTRIFAEDFNIPNEEIIAIEETLGTNPEGDFDTVDERISDLEDNPSGGGAWGEITGTLSDQTDLQAALDAKEDVLPTDSFSTTFTANGSGSPGTSSSVTIKVTRVGDWVHLFIPGFTLTTGLTSTQLNANTAIPSGFRPQTNPQIVAFFPLTNAGGFTIEAGLVVIGTNGIISVRRDAAGNNFTAVSSCGSSDGVSFTYFVG